jgi:hypothetical protein
VIIQYNSQQSTTCSIGLLGGLLCPVLNLVGGLVTGLLGVIDGAAAATLTGTDIIATSNQSNVAYISLDRPVRPMLDYTAGAVGASYAGGGGFSGSLTLRSGSGSSDVWNGASTAVNNVSRMSGGLIAVVIYLVYRSTLRNLQSTADFKKAPMPRFGLYTAEGLRQRLQLAAARRDFRTGPASPARPLNEPLHADAARSRTEHRTLAAIPWYRTRLVLQHLASLVR